MWHFHRNILLYLCFYVLHFTTQNEQCDGDSCSSDVTTDKNDGGWYTDFREQVAKPGPCNVERVEAATLTQEDFIKKYAYTAPVVISGIKYNEEFRKMCSKQNMLREFGSKTIRLSSANTYSYKKVDVTLREYVENILKPQSLYTLGNETLYWFGDNNYTEWSDLFEQYNQPQWKLPKTEGVLSFGLAGAGTGVPFHFHGPGFGEVIYGRKRWFLTPPEQKPSFDPDQTTLHWLVNNYPHLSENEKPLECTIGPGDLIYFPDRWWHGTLNIDTSVFISTFLGPM
ncbi:jmjC domain-containing protein 8 [Lingula anatina]|uniref:JmjC domain-containing protein 8 n=1 Tax=Lingula anatina TaxID=7574 RepID=A0A1S3ICC2_LINAN|nr:jmjC domain-containing protein 8 [Lingula anatina]|eukprot:XP_013395910.1 jmjC domain-containing protein 8 [Lingula anatina]